MKFHKSLVQAVVDTLQQIFVEGVYADKAVEQVLKQNPKWGSRDRRFIAETTYGIVRWWRLLNEILGETTSNRFYKIIGIYQLLNGQDLPDWEEFNELEKGAILEKANSVKQIRKYREAYPDWLDELMVKELGEEVWEKESCALNIEAAVVLRVNTLKTNKDKVLRLLQEQGIETEMISDYADALRLVKRQNIQSLKEYKQGLIEIQDASSQLISPFLEVKEGMTVIDACAGAGGKSLHIAAMMHNKGHLISMDVEERKLKELQRRAERAGVSIIKTRVVSEAAIQQLKSSADRLLLDVPCSGLGVIRRNPDAKWKLNEGFINEIKKTQQQIIAAYSEMLKPEGIMVYATCSILPSENQKQVEFFIQNHPNFVLIEDKKILASDGFDGFYMAKLKRLK
jgi:16S rRNA (cytosine967-C5)-methyltransferase